MNYKVRNSISSLKLMWLFKVRMCWKMAWATLGCLLNLLVNLYRTFYHQWWMKFRWNWVVKMVWGNKSKKLMWLTERVRDTWNLSIHMSSMIHSPNSSIWSKHWLHTKSSMHCACKNSASIRDHCSRNNCDEIVIVP